MTGEIHTEIVVPPYGSPHSLFNIHLLSFVLFLKSYSSLVSLLLTGNLLLSGRHLQELRMAIKTKPMLHLRSHTRLGSTMCAVHELRDPLSICAVPRLPIHILSKTKTKNGQKSVRELSLPKLSKIATFFQNKIHGSMCLVCPHPMWFSKMQVDFD